MRCSEQLGLYLSMEGGKGNRQQGLSGSIGKNGQRGNTQFPSQIHSGPNVRHRHAPLLHELAPCC